MAQNEIGEIRLAGGGGSSAMPHKANPVGAEVLVALARFAAGLAGTLHQGLVAENERSRRRLDAGMRDPAPARRRDGRGPAPRDNPLRRFAVCRRGRRHDKIRSETKV